MPLALGAQQFEVASVKPADPAAVGNTFNFTPGGGLTIKNSTLRGIIQSAYDVPSFQIEGGPAWMNSARYDIFAKSPFGEEPAGRPGATTMQQTRVRLQALIADRFQLKVHRETKDVPMYVLTVGKSGAKLAAPAAVQSVPDGMHMVCGRMTGTNTTMANFARSLTRELSRLVEDRTGLTGKYDFQVDFTPDGGACEGASADLPSLFAALQGTLGLKLEATKGPMEMVVVDHAEKPSGN